MQLRLLLEGAQRRPLRALDRVRLRLNHALLRVAVADPAAKLDDLAVFHPGHPVAVGAGERRWTLIFQIHFAHPCSWHCRLRDRGRRARERDQRRRDRRDRQTVVDLDARERAAWHVGAEGFRRILDDRDAPRRFDAQEAGRAIVLRARQDDAGDARPIHPRRGAEERIDRRPAAVLARRRREADRAALEQHVPVGRRDVNHAGTYRLVLARLARAQRAGAREQLRQAAARLRREVQDHEERRGKIGRQRRD